MCCFIPPGVPNIWCAFNSLNALPFWCLSTPEYHKLHELRHGSSSSSCLQLWAQSLLSEPQESVEFLHYFSCCFFAGMLKHQKNPFKTYITFGVTVDLTHSLQPWHEDCSGWRRYYNFLQLHHKDRRIKKQVPEQLPEQVPEQVPGQIKINKKFKMP